MSSFLSAPCSDAWSVHPGKSIFLSKSATKSVTQLGLASHSNCVVIFVARSWKKNSFSRIRVAEAEEGFAIGLRNPRPSSMNPKSQTLQAFDARAHAPSHPESRTRMWASLTRVSGFGFRVHAQRNSTRTCTTGKQNQTPYQNPNPNRISTICTGTEETRAGNCQIADSQGEMPYGEPIVSTHRVSP